MRVLVCGSRYEKDDPEDGQWICWQCEIENPLTNTHCWNCGEKR